MSTITQPTPREVGAPEEAGPKVGATFHASCIASQALAVQEVLDELNAAKHALREIKALLGIAQAALDNGDHAVAIEYVDRAYSHTTLSK